MRLPFLTARWTDLVVINFEVEPSVLQPLVPFGLQLDLFEGKALCSVLGFHFADTRLFGVIPSFTARNFDELNLRFYVRRTVAGEERRGCVFVREAVPTALIAVVARALYDEPYEVRDVRLQRDECSSDGSRALTIVCGDVSLRVTTEGELMSIDDGALASFILERYWGYTQRADGTVSEYRVAHPAWRYWRTASCEMVGDLAGMYPAVLRRFLCGSPHSSLVAQGSPVSVYYYRRELPRFSIDAAPMTSQKGWILFDARCGACSLLARSCRSMLEAIGFACSPIQSEWCSRVTGAAPEQLERDVRLLLRDGTMRSGADVYCYLLRQRWYTWLLGVVLAAPGVRRVTWLLYRICNRNRHRISRVCGLTPELGREGHRESNTRQKD